MMRPHERFSLRTLPFELSGSRDERGISMRTNSSPEKRDGQKKEET
jgi:hypothetical protein